MEIATTSIVGLLIGTFIRLLPELVKIINKLIDNYFEIKMLKISNHISDNQTQSKYVQSTSVVDDTKYLELISKVQQKKTRIQWVDVTRALVRPYTTYILLFLYVSIKITYIILNPHVALIMIYTPSDISILSGVMSFWFLGRVLEKK